MKKVKRKYLQEKDIPDIYDDPQISSGEIYRYVDNFLIVDSEGIFGSIEELEQGKILYIIGSLYTPEYKWRHKEDKDILVLTSDEEHIKQEYDRIRVPYQETDLVKIGPLLEWTTSCDSSSYNSIIWARTLKAWYRLTTPSDSYADIFTKLITKLDLCYRIIDVIEESPSKSVQQIIEVIKEQPADEEDASPSFMIEDVSDFVNKNAEFIVTQIERHEEELLDTKFYKELMNIALSKSESEETTEEFVEDDVIITGEKKTVKVKSKKKKKKSKEKSDLKKVKSKSANKEKIKPISSHKIMYYDESIPFNPPNEFLDENVIMAQEEKRYKKLPLRILTKFTACDDVKNTLSYLYPENIENSKVFIYGEVHVGKQIISCAKVGKIEELFWVEKKNSKGIAIMVRTKRAWYILFEATKEYMPFFDQLKRSCNFVETVLKTLQISNPSTPYATLVETISKNFPSNDKDNRFQLTKLKEEGSLIIHMIKRKKIRCDWDDSPFLIHLRKTKRKQRKTKKTKPTKKRVNLQPPAVTDKVKTIWTSFWDILVEEEKGENVPLPVEKTVCRLEGKIKFGNKFIERGGVKLYDTMSFGGCNFKLGDCVYFMKKKPIEKKVNLAQCDVGRIKEIFVNKNGKGGVKLIILKRGRDTFLGDTCDPHALFISDQSATIEIEKIIFSCKVIFGYNAIIDTNTYDFYCRMCYDESTYSFVNPPGFTNADMTPQNIFPWKQGFKWIKNKNEKKFFGKDVSYTGFSRKGEEFHIGDFVYFERNLEKIKTYSIGKIINLMEKMDVKKIARLRIFRRPWEIRKIDANTNLKEVFHTDKEIEIDVDKIVRKCFVHHIEEIEDLSQYCKEPDYYYYSMKYIGKKKFESFEYKGNSRKSVKVPEKSPPLSTFDAFAGCGGLSWGAEKAGFEIKWAVEKLKQAAETFKLNHPNCKVFNDDINNIVKQMIQKKGEHYQDLPKKGQVGALIGGPPCQGHTGLNRFQKHDDPLNILIVSFLSLIELLEPRFVVMENVVGLLKTGKQLFLKLLISCFVALNYQIRFGVLMAWHYSVPQFRQRVIFLAAKAGEKLPELPHPETTPPMYEFLNNRGLLSSIVKSFHHVAICSDYAPFPPVTISDAISDLPEIENGEKNFEMNYASDPKTPYQKLMRGEETVLTFHYSKQVGDDQFELVQRIPKRGEESKSGFWNWRDLPEEYIPACLPHNAHKHGDWRPLFGRLNDKEAFPTILTTMSLFRSRILHPVQNRIISVREAARAQGFADSFKFSTQKENDLYMMIGNAVPPLMAYSICRNVMIAAKCSQNETTINTTATLYLKNTRKQDKEEDSSDDDYEMDSQEKEQVKEKVEETKDIQTLSNEESLLDNIECRILIEEYDEMTEISNGSSTLPNKEIELQQIKDSSKGVKRKLENKTSPKKKMKQTLLTDLF